MGNYANQIITNLVAALRNQYIWHGSTDSPKI